jgi:hypothetical protein
MRPMTGAALVLLFPVITVAAAVAPVVVDDEAAQVFLNKIYSLHHLADLAPVPPVPLFPHRL